MKKTKLMIATDLANRKLKEPKGLKKWMKHYLKHERSVYNSKLPRFVDTLEMYNDKLLKRTWSFRKHDEKFEYQEIVRKLEGLNITVTSGVYTNMGGRQVIFSENGWIDFNQYFANKKSYEFYGCLFDTNEILESNEFRYSAYKQYKGSLNVVEYMELYRKYPKIELLVKAGYSHLVQYVRYLDLTKKKIEDITGLPNYLINLLETESYLVVRKIYRKFNIGSEIEYHLHRHQYEHICKYFTLRKTSFINYIADLTRQRLITYNDYLRMAESNGMDMNKKDVLFPTDLREAHDIVTKNFEQIKSRINDEKIMEKSNQLKVKNPKNEDYIVVIPSSQQDFINESKVIGHCVSSYVERFIKDQCTIYFVRNKENIEEPLTTLEVIRNQLTQYRGCGAGTGNAVPDESIVSFIKKWCKLNRIECSI